MYSALSVRARVYFYRDSQAAGIAKPYNDAYAQGNMDNVSNMRRGIVFASSYTYACTYVYIFILYYNTTANR